VLLCLLRYTLYMHTKYRCSYTLFYLFMEAIHNVWYYIVNIKLHIIKSQDMKQYHAWKLINLVMEINHYGRMYDAQYYQQTTGYII